MKNIEPSVHDNHLMAYAVNGRERSITFQTEYPHTEPAELTDVVFEDVLAYHFQHDLFGNIIFDIEEVSLAQFVEFHGAQCEAGCKWGWPWGWDIRKERLLTYVERMGVKAYELSSSYGMTGWVLCAKMKKTRRS